MRSRLWSFSLAAIAGASAGSRLLVGCANLDGLGAGGADAAGDTGGDTGGDTASGADGSGDGGSSEASGYCASLSPQPTFCADFDDVPIAEFGWTSAAAGDAGTISLVSDFFRSPPNAARMALNPTMASCNYVRLERTWANAVTSVQLAFDVRVGDADGGWSVGSGAGLGGVALAFPSGQSCDVTLFSNGTSASLGQSDFAADGGFNSPAGSKGLVLWPLPGTWSHVEIDVDTSMTPSASVTIDGVSALANASTGLLPPECTGPASPTIYVGFRCDVAPAAAEQRFDNVTFNMH